MKKSRYKVLKIELSDYTNICIADKETNKVLCHMNIFLAIDDVVPAAELERLANIMCEALNKQS